MRSIISCVRWVLRLIPVILMGGVTAQPLLNIELNKLEAVGNSCRLYFVIRNDASHGFERLKLDLVFFDRDGLISTRMGVEAGPLHAQKMAVKRFDLTDPSCPEISRILLNEVLSCDGEHASEGADCLELITLSNRTNVDFLK